MNWGPNDYEPTRDKIVFNYKNASFCLAFTFGQDRMNSIFIQHMVQMLEILMFSMDDEHEF